MTRNRVVLFLLFLFFLFRAAPVEYGNSWARGRTRVAAAHLCHSQSNARPKLHQQHCILNSLSKARDQTHFLLDTVSGSYPNEPQWELLVFILNLNLWAHHFLSEKVSNSLVSEQRINQSNLVYSFYNKIFYGSKYMVTQTFTFFL